MTTFKTTSGDYTLTCQDGAGTFTVNANTVFNGNVIYNQPSAVTSAFITVAANNTGAITDAGLLTQTGPSSFAGLRFDVTSNAWQISSNVYANGSPVYAYANLSAKPAGANTQIQYNDGGDFFGANVNFTYDYANSVVTLNGYEILGNIGATPSAPSNAVAIYNKAPGLGQTGLYVVGTSVDDETVAYTKAKLLAIIF
jgi:hypothetical protein